MRDPRSDGRYAKARKLWLSGFRGGMAVCCMCGRPIDTALPGTHEQGPTIEHRLPIREIQRRARDWAECVALACDTSLWSIAHRRCNSAQGARAKNARQKLRRAHVEALKSSRQW